MHHLQQKVCRRLLLKLEPLPDGARCVQHDANAQRKVRLLRKLPHLLRRTPVIQQAKVLLLQPGHKMSLAVDHGEHQVHFVNAHLQRRHARPRIIVARLLRWLLSILGKRGAAKGSQMGRAGSRGVEVEMEQSWDRMWHSDWRLLAVGRR